MVLLKSFLAEGKEYMVLDGRQGIMPGPVAVQLLMDPLEGLGGDRLLVLGDSEHLPIISYLPDGTQVPAGAKEQALLRRKAEFELRLTDSFVTRLREADEAAGCLAQAV